MNLIKTVAGNRVPVDRKGPAALAMLLCVTATPILAFDGDDSFPAHPPMHHQQGWLAAPGLNHELNSGLYHEVWRADPYGTLVDSDHHTGIRHRFGTGLGLDTGIAQYGFGPAAARYQEYYFGLSYDVWQGRVWYTNDYQGSGTVRAHYEFGVSSQLSADFSLSARFAYGDNGFGFADEQHPAYVFSAQKRDLYGFGLNLQLMGSADPRHAETEDLRFMGVLSRPLP